jgi:hypothetical protein
VLDLNYTRTSKIDMEKRKIVNAVIEKNCHLNRDKNYDAATGSAPTGMYVS